MRWPDAWSCQDHVIPSTSPARLPSPPPPSRPPPFVHLEGNTTALAPASHTVSWSRRAPRPAQRTRGTTICQGRSGERVCRNLTEAPFPSNFSLKLIFLRHGAILGTDAAQLFGKFLGTRRELVCLGPPIHHHIITRSYLQVERG